MLSEMLNAQMVFHNYYVFASGVKNFKPKTFTTRKAAEIYMQNVCLKNHITDVECVEESKHERKYSNHQGIRFYINRI